MGENRYNFHSIVLFWNIKAGRNQLYA